MTAISCAQCKFDFRHLAVTLQNPRPEEGSALLLTCPLCGSAVTLAFANLGVLLRGKGSSATFSRWKLSTKDEQKPVVREGAFVVRFDTLGAIEPRDICYAKVPVFVDEDGALIVPSIPVRPEFVDCLDLAALLKLQEKADLHTIVGSQLQVTLPLKGIPDPVRLSLPLHSPSAGAPSRENAFSDVNIRVWPPFELPKWEHYLTGLAGASKAADELIAQGVLRARVVAGKEGSEWLELDSRQRAGGSVVRATPSAPLWVAIEVYDPKRPDAAQAGGLFPVRLARKNASGGTSFGLDFGTSNSCVAVTGDMTRDGPTPQHLPATDQFLKETSWNHYVLRSGPELGLPVHTGPDLWPQARGFGQHQDMIPTELLLPGLRRELRGQTSRLGRWLLGIDFGIPGYGESPNYSEVDHIVAEFKWAQAVSRDVPAEEVAQVQATFIAALLMTSYVRAALLSGATSSRLDVKWSYPMAFADDDLQRLSQACQLAEARLNELTGLTWTFESGADESAAAAGRDGATLLDRPNLQVAVYLDMGGGSTDIAVKVNRGKKGWKLEYITSIAYAGTALLDGYAGALERGSNRRTGSCLVSGVTPESLRRLIRRSTNARKLLDNGEYFNLSHKRKTDKRTNHFYAYLIEYVARIVAGGLLDGRFYEAPEGEPPFPKQLGIAFFILGNGWGFFGEEVKKIPTQLVDAIFDRVGSLLMSDRSEHAKRIISQLEETGVALEKYVLVPGNLPEGHSKAAVAFGVLDVNTKSDEDKPDRACVIGWNTRAGSEVIPWYARYTNSGALPSGVQTQGAKTGALVFGGAKKAAATTWYKSVAGSRCDWESDGPPLPDDLIGPFDLDDGLKTTLGQLQLQCREEGKPWFRKSPYEVMLEQLFKPRLGEIA